MDHDRKKDIGTGYAKFGVGKVAHDASNTDLALMWEPLKELEESKAKIQSVNYKIFICHFTKS